MQITINHLDESTPAALYLHYPRQTSRQPCYVEIDCSDATLSAGVSGEIGNGMPSRVWHRLALRWPIPCLRAAAANALLDEIAPIAQRIVDGYTQEWDGHNYVGHYTDDAVAAEGEIRVICDESGGEDREVCAWDAADWLADADLSVAADATYEQLVELAESLREDARANGDVDVLRGLDDYLSDLRDRAREVRDDETDQG